MAPIIDRKTKYDVGERVLCYHESQFYKATVLDKKVVSTRLKYYVHYDDWSTKWNEFVPETRICKLNDNVSKRKRKESVDILESKKSKSNKNNGCERNATEQDKEPEEKGTENCDDLDAIALAVETVTIYENKEEVKVKLPDAFKEMLVDDWKGVVKCRKLVKLPATTPVTQLLTEYEQFKLSGPHTELRKYTLNSFLHGLKQYFDISLPNKLLYPFEKQQYDEVTECGKKQPSDIYGSRHLLRFISKFGEILAHTSITKEKCYIIINLLNDFLRYFLQHSYALFSNDDYICRKRKKRKQKIKEDNCGSNKVS